MRFPTKIAVVVRDDLASWQRLNVTAFVASGVAGAVDEVIGQPYQDASGNRYLPMFRQPVLVYAADATAIAQVHARALSRGLRVAVYTEELFKTAGDDDNRAAVRAVPAADLQLVGLGLYGTRNDVDRVTKGLALHP